MTLLIILIIIGAIFEFIAIFHPNDMVSTICISLVLVIAFIGLFILHSISNLKHDKTDTIQKNDPKCCCQCKHCNK